MTATVTPADRRADQPSEVDDIDRREFIVGGMALVVLSACGGDTDRDTDSGTDGSSPDADYPRQVEHADGTVEIGRRPGRVVTTSNFEDLDALLSLGIAPVQFGVREDVLSITGGAERSFTWHERALEQLESTPERVVATNPPNVETVAAARPDLIVGHLYMIEQVLDQLGEVAPVVVLLDDWRENLRIVGEALAMEAEADAAIERANRELDDALAGLALDAPTVAFVTAAPGGVVYSLAHESVGLADVFVRAGFSLLDELRADTSADRPVVEISPEQVERLAGADLLAVLAYDEDATGELEQNPLYARLPAVQAGRVLRLSGADAQAVAAVSAINIQHIVTLIRRGAALLER